MVRVPINQWWAGIVVYLFAIIGISLLGVKLSSIVADQATILALPYLDNSPPKVSLIERRHIEATLAVQPLPGGMRRRVAALEAPPTSANILAARLDLAEKEDLIEPASPAHVATPADGSLTPDSQPSSIAARSYEKPKFRTARSNSRHTVSAGEVFNRSFGVITVAVN